jgi:hypothetical protein
MERVEGSLDSPRVTYTVEEPQDGISERSTSVDDGEGSVGSWDDLANYMRHLVSHRCARSCAHSRVPTRAHADMPRMYTANWIRTSSGVLSAPWTRLLTGNNAGLRLGWEPWGARYSVIESRAPSRCLNATVMARPW